MIFLQIFLAVAIFVAIACILTAYVCFLKVFYSKKTEEKEEYPIPEGEAYEEYRDQMVEWVKESRRGPYTEYSVRSFDGLVLKGKYYEYANGAPIDILFHGYRGNAERDLSGGVARCRMLRHNVLIVDHRASGESEGHVITFGINECKDVEKWVELVLREIDPNAKILLGGISMGGATVMMASAIELPKNVVGAVADCGYTSPEEIIRKVVKETGLPERLLFPFIKLGAKLFGRFDLTENSPIEAVKKSRIPIIFFHGDADGFVPAEMSAENYNACTSPKRLVMIKGADHGLAFPADQQSYVDEIERFFAPYLE